MISVNEKEREMIIDILELVTDTSLLLTNIHLYTEFIPILQKTDMKTSVYFYTTS